MKIYEFLSQFVNWEAMPVKVQELENNGYKAVFCGKAIDIPLRLFYSPIDAVDQILPEEEKQILTISIGEKTKNVTDH